MEKKYTIYDIRNDNIIKGISATSPLKAVQSVYPTAQRVTQGGDLVVYGYSTNKSTGYFKAYCYKENELLQLREKERQAKQLHGYVPYQYLLEEEKLYKTNKRC